MATKSSRNQASAGQLPWQSVELAAGWGLVVLLSMISGYLATFLRGGDFAIGSWSATPSQGRSGFSPPGLADIAAALDPSAIDSEHNQESRLSQDDRPSLFPITASSALGFALSGTALILAGGGGIGGGGVLVPIYTMIMGFRPKFAIPLSNVTIFGGALANLYLNLRKRHPLADRPLIDWDLTLIMEPVTIAGALIGTTVNKLLPETVLVLSMVALLAMTARTTFRIAGRLRRAETLSLIARGRITASNSSLRPSELVTLVEKVGNEASSQDDEFELEADSSALVREQNDHGSDCSRDEGIAAGKPCPGAKQTEIGIPGGDALTVSVEKADCKTRLPNENLEFDRHTPWFNVCVLGALFVVVVALNLLKGGGAYRSPVGIECGSPAFWSVNLLILLWIAAVVAFVRRHLMRRHEAKVARGYAFVDGDVAWDSRSTVTYPLLCGVAGFCSGMFGIGGGIVKGPIMLALGVHPAVSSATSACMILFTSMTATTSYFAFGLLAPDSYALACLLLGFFSTCLGQVGLRVAIARSGNRYSYIAYSMGTVVVLSALLMTVQSLLEIADHSRGDDSDPQQQLTGGICGVVG